MNKPRHSDLWLRFALLVFATSFAVIAVLTLGWWVLYRCRVLSVDPFGRHIPVLILALGSLLLGAVIALYVGRLIVRPVQRISEAFDALSARRFEVRVPEDEPLREIREMAQHFNAMAYDLAHIETLRSDFVANVSHEFKTPLASIEGYAALLQTPGLLPEKHDRYVGKILENTHRLAHLSGNILLLSKLENQTIVPGQTRFRLDEQLRKCILLLEDKWTAKAIQWEIELFRQTYYGSEELLEQIWINLLDNAIKHSASGGSIAVRLTDTGDTLCICIADRGDGMSAEVQKHIFEKFYQGEPSHTAEGNGLGLALVKRIAELCRGTVSVRSRPGEGAAFTVSLPKSD